MIVWIVIGLLAASLLLWLALAAGRDNGLADEADAAPEALARYGTREAAEMLEDEGRGHELRSLGFHDRR